MWFLHVLKISDGHSIPASIRIFMRCFVLCIHYGIFAHQIGGSLEKQKLQVQFQLPDNTEANHFVGNILTVLHRKQQFSRAMLTPEHLFRLESNGDLFTRDVLDRDAVCGLFGCCEAEYCHIELEAYLFDTHPTPTTVNVNIYVTDSNDNAPKFPNRQTEYSSAPEVNMWDISIPESAPVGSRHSLPTATDKDSPRFGVQNYRLVSTTETVNIGFPNLPDAHCSFELFLPPPMSKAQRTTVVPEVQLNRPLDREQKPHCEFYLVAEDAGSPPLSSSVLIRVNILDANDNAPQFTNFSATDSTITIPESIAIGSTIYKFSVNDPDEGPNGEVMLSIDWDSTFPGLNQTIVRGLSSKYNLNPKSGELRVVQPLDYEKQLERRLLLVVKASDQGSPRLTSTTSLTIIVNDVNDNAPKIELLEVGKRERGQGVGSDADEELLRENDAEPRLLKLISVTDVDGVSAGRVSCHLSPQHQDDFKLTPYSNTMYGLINSHAFDYEREASQTGHLAVRIECIDDAVPRKSSQQWIQIPLIDINDNWPQFSRANYQFYVAEDVLVGTEIGRIIATDADSDQAGELVYELSSDKPELLSLIRIDSTTGSIFTASRMDRESLDVLEFHVTASDGGDIPRDNTQKTPVNQKGLNVKTNTTGLTIFITDVNDNAPIYTGPMEIHITEGVPVGTEIPVSLEFSDPDLGNNGTVQISLVKTHSRYTGTLDNAGNMQFHDQPFSVTDSSKLVTTGEIDRENRAQFIIYVIGVDQGEAVKLTTTASITVHVDDVNDNEPILIYPRNGSLLYGLSAESDWMNKMSTIPTDTAPNTIVVNIRGKDLDAGPNGTISYHLVQAPTDDKKQIAHNDFDTLNGFAYFDLDETNGQLRTHWGKQDEDEALMRTNNVGQADNKTASLLYQKPTKKVRASNAPSPGLYVLYVELRDGGRPNLVTSAVFYVNISEAVGGAFGLAFFTGANMSNTIILVLIMVCSLALIVSLTAAIFWVRFRKDTTDQTVTNGRQYSGYLGPTVICQDSGPNGYYYPTSYAPIGSPITVRDYDPDYTNQDIGCLSEKQPMYKQKLSECGLECFHNGTYPIGMVTGNSVDSSVMEKPTAVSPVNSFQDTLQFVQVGSCSELHQYNPNSGPPDWSNPTDQMLLEPIVSFATDMNYPSQLQYDLFSHNQHQGNNNSCGGSDSGVDSGAGVLGTPQGHVVNASPTDDVLNRGKQSNKHSTLPRTSQIVGSSSTVNSNTMLPGKANPNMRGDNHTMASFMSHMRSSENAHYSHTLRENIKAS